MQCPSIKDLPAPPTGKQGWPWTEETERRANQANVPRVSIITPSYNQGAFIEETIRSILLQGYPDVELVIMDGGSRDETVDVIKKYERWIKYWVSEKDGGQSSAINAGIPHVSGELVNWLNSDDLLDKDALWNIQHHYDDRYSCYIGTFREFTNEGIVRAPSRMPHFASMEELLVSPAMAQPSLFYRADLFKKGVNEAFHFCMDLELFKRVTADTGLESICWLDANLSLFRVHGESKTSNFQQKFTIDRYNIIYSMLKSLDNVPARVNAIFARFESLYYYRHKWPMKGVDQKKLLSALIDAFLNECHNSLTVQEIRYLYLFTAKNYPGKQFDSYLLPLKIAYRKMNGGAAANRLQ